jgi:hypothetical protein
VTGELAQRDLRAGDIAMTLDQGPPARGTLLFGKKVAAVFVSASWGDAVESACSYLRGAGLTHEADALFAEWRKKEEL